MTDPIIPPYPADARETCSTVAPSDAAAEVVAEALPFVVEAPAPNAPLPGIAPAMRRVDGGYVREDAHPGAGEPDWKAEALKTLPCGHPASLALRSVESSTVLCELCEAMSAACDAEKMEASLREELAAAHAERAALRDDLQLARESHAGTLAMFDSLRAEVERVQGERDHMSRRLYRFRDAILRAFADTRGENALRQKIADICAPAKFASMLSTDADPAPSPAPALGGFWRCEECGEANDSQGAGPWRFNGRIWQHYCPGRHPQAGPADAKRMDAPASTGTGGEEAHACIVCPPEIRNLLAVAWNVTVWDPRRAQGRIDRFYLKLDQLAEALAGLKPLSDAHFAAIEHHQQAPAVPEESAGRGPETGPLSTGIRFDPLRASRASGAEEVSFVYPPAVCIPGPGLYTGKFRAGNDLTAKPGPVCGAWHAKSESACILAPHAHGVHVGDYSGEGDLFAFTYAAVKP